MSDADASSNWTLIRRLFGLAWRYRLHCLRVLGLQLLLLTMGIGGLSFTGLGIDYIRHKMSNTPMGANVLHVALPNDWSRLARASLPPMSPSPPSPSALPVSGSSRLWSCGVTIGKCCSAATR